MHQWNVCNIERITSFNYCYRPVQQISTLSDKEEKSMANLVKIINTKSSRILKSITIYSFKKCLCYCSLSNVYFNSLYLFSVCLYAYLYLYTAEYNNKKCNESKIYLTLWLLFKQHICILQVKTIVLIFWWSCTLVPTWQIIQCHNPETTIWLFIIVVTPDLIQVQH
jgi:hypothetical protein